MAAKRSREVAEPSPAPPSLDEWKRLLPATTLVAAVLAVLVLGALLQAGPEAPGSSPRRASPVPPAARIAPPADPAPPSPAPAAPTVAAGDLARRAESDLRRLGGAGEGWTLQFMLACDPANVAAKAAVLEDDPDFYLLPKRHDDRDCYRVCWGVYASRERAVAAHAFPAALASITQRPQPVPVDKAVR